MAGPASGPLQRPQNQNARDNVTIIESSARPLVSGLGPCDLTNVVKISSSDSDLWLGVFHRGTCVT
jgi:hypothetical protein